MTIQELQAISEAISNRAVASYAATFADTITRIGAGRAPNGADYKLVRHDRDHETCSVDRVYNGRRDTIVSDYHGNLFSNLDAARAWAIYDGSREMAPEGTPIFNRKQIV